MLNAVKYKKQPSTHCRACGTIKISKYVNNFLSTNPTTLILSSLVSEFCPNFDKESKSDFFVCVCVVVGGGGGLQGPLFCSKFL